VPLCFEFVNFAENKLKKEGAVKGKEIKNFPGRSASQRRANLCIYKSEIPAK
jgi:hypothetical protein